jgi:hypothetical protein
MFGSLTAAYQQVRVFTCLFLLSCCVAASPPALAQTTSGTLVGQVHDSVGKGLAKVKITVVNEENGNARAAKSDEAGNYSIFNLPPGNYKLTAAKDGFREETISGFPVQFNQKNLVELPKFTLHAAALAEKASDVASDFSSQSLPNPAAGAEPIDPASVAAASTRFVEDAGAATGQPAQAATPLQVADGSKYAALVHTVDAARSTNFGEPEIQALPLGGESYMRTFDAFALLATGVFPPPYTPGVRGPGVGYGIGTAGQFSVNGMRARSNNFSVDGSDNNDPDVGVRRQGFVALVPQAPESVKEVSISTLLWDAELGRNFGSQVNAVSKYGANTFHGQVYGFLTDSRFNARNFFDYTSGASGGKDPLTRSQAGFILGGPIYRDRTQLFGSLERVATHASAEQHFATPAAYERSFLPGREFGSLFPGSTASDILGILGPLRDVTPLGRNVLSLYPLPNNPAGPFGRNTYTRILPADGSGWITSLKLTHQVSAANLLNIRYNFTDDDRILPSVNRAIDSTLESRVPAQNLSVIFDSAPATQVSNQARFSFGRTRLVFQEQAGSPFIFSKSSGETVNVVGESPQSLASQTGTIGGLLIEPFSPVGVDVFTLPQARASNTFQYADSVYWALGSHSLKFGGNIRRYQLNSRMDRLYRPQVVFGGGVASFGSAYHSTIPWLPPGTVGFVGGADVPISGVQLASLGVASSVLQTITSGIPDSMIGLRFTEYHLFINNNWRIRKNLSLDYGLRYEYSSIPREVNGRIERALQLSGLGDGSGSRFDTPDRTASFDQAVQGYTEILADRGEMYDPDRNNFGPHFGFAWSPGRGGKTAVRGGYGIYYDTVLGAVISQSRNVFPNEIPVNIDPLFLSLDPLTLNNPAFS